MNHFKLTLDILLNTLSIVVLPEDDPTKFNEGHNNAADYVILTDCAKLV